ncbi:hypothetical protein LTR04_003017, partial [Oleoguttula sp. CCFEE 6159]
MPGIWNTLQNVTSLVSALTPHQQCGDSVFGTLQAPTFPQSLTDNPMPNGFPWGTRTPQNSDATNINDIPNTGVTRYYDFSIARAVISPDGVPRDSILVNGQFPGPTIEANWGDYIQVTVHNKIENPVEGTSLHWHGMLQRETPWYDGVPSVS